MEVRKFIASGGMNQDDAPLFVPEGDWKSARNISLGITKGGLDNTISLVDSVDSVASANTGTTLSSPTAKGAVTDSEGRVYILMADSAYGKIVRLNADNSVTLILDRYDHGSCSLSYGKIVLIGDILVWNYHGEGTPLSWLTTRSSVNLPDISDIRLIRPPLNLKFDVSSSASGSPETFRKNSWQVAGRYIYDDGTVSSLGVYNAFPETGEENSNNSHIGVVGSITYTSPNTSHPVYATQVEFYARKDGIGDWRRFATSDVTQGVAVSAVFSGSTFETLPSNEANKSFDSVPVTSKAIEAAQNRVFLGNNEDDLPGGDYDTMSITVGNGDTLSNSSSSSNPLSYLNYTDSSSGRISNWESKNKPFANDSGYKIGYIYRDDSGRTRGVEDSATFQTGLFAYPIFPEITITRNSAPPSWAKYWELVVTKNLDKDFSMEGYASFWYFEYDKEDGSIGIERNPVVMENIIDTEVLYKSSRLVIDLDGMFSEGHFYKFQEGDRVNIAFGDPLSSSKGVKSGFTVLRQDGTKIICDISQVDFGIGLTELSKWNGFFEIYSPSDSDENLFYSIGQSIAIDDSSYGLSNISNGATRVLTGGSNSRIIGDMHTYAFNMTTYENQIPIFDNRLSRRLSSSQSIGTTFEKITFDLENSANSNGKDYIPSGIAFQGDGVYSVKKDMNVIASATILTTGGTTGDFRMIKTFTNGSTTTISERLGESTGSGTTQFTVNVSMRAGETIHLEGKSSSGSFSVSANANGPFDICEETDRLFTEQPGITAFEFIDKTDITLAKELFLVRKMNRIRGRNTWDRPLGKPYVEIDRRNRGRKEIHVRHSGPLIRGTSVNLISSFDFTDEIELGNESGQITALQIASKNQGEGAVMLGIQERGASSMYIGERVISNPDGFEQIVASDRVINSVRPLKGGYGSIDAGSVREYRGNVFYWDAINKKAVMRSNNGLTAISDVKMKSYFITKGSGATAFVDPFNDTVYFTWGTESVGFNVKRGRWTHFYDYSPDLGVARDEGYVALSGNDISESLQSSFGVLGGSSVTASINIPFNFPSPVKLDVIALKSPVPSDYLQNDDGSNTDIVEPILSQFTATISNEEGQSTTIVDANFKEQSRVIYAQVLRDENSGGTNPLIEGDYMIGSSNEVALTINPPVKKRMPLEVVGLGYTPESGHV